MIKREGETRRAGSYIMGLWEQGVGKRKKPALYIQFQPSHMCS